MGNKARGFTLIELLIVVAILGILAALLIANIFPSIQKAKQKRTMTVILKIATACADYTTDRGEAPDSGNQSGEINTGSEFVSLLSPFYIKLFPYKDEWGHRLVAYTGSSIDGVYGIPGDNIAEDDFIIASLGSDGEYEGWTYDPSQPDYGYFELNSKDDFRKDLINYNANWIRAPRVAMSGSGS
jgi:general secretion pathway protein G